MLLVLLVITVALMGLQMNVCLEIVQVGEEQERAQVQEQTRQWEQGREQVEAHLNAGPFRIVMLLANVYVTIQQPVLLSSWRQLLATHVLVLRVCVVSIMTAPCVLLRA